MAFTDLAICLRRTDYSETSLVLRMMTREHGQIALMAKGIKRPKSRLGVIDLLSVGQAVFTLPRENSVSTLGVLTAWEQAGNYPVLRTDLLRYSTAMLAGELLARLTGELDPQPASFDAMVSLLESLQKGEPPLRRLADFARALLADVGLTPGFEQCVSCGARLESAGGLLPFSGRRGGALCPQCHPAPGEDCVRVSRPLRDFFMLGSSTGGKLALEITRLVAYHVQGQIGRPLSSAAALERSIAAALAELKSKS